MSGALLFVTDSAHVMFPGKSTIRNWFLPVLMADTSLSNAALGPSPSADDAPRIDSTNRNMVSAPPRVASKLAR